MKSRSQIVRERKIMLFVFAGLLVSVLICSVVFGSIRAQAASSDITYKYYTSVAIEPGDSIWKIAQEYKTEECGDMDAYVAEICKLNHISSTDPIHSGQYLTVPYYSEDYR